jgi:hypothetical protein
MFDIIWLPASSFAWNSLDFLPTMFAKVAMSPKIKAYINDDMINVTTT